MMRMTFEASSSVTLLFNFWDVHGPAGMVLSVAVVFLLTLFYEMLKVWRVWLGNRSKRTQPQPQPQFPIPNPFPSPYAPNDCHREGSVSLENSPSESSLTPIDPPATPPAPTHSWLDHGIQAVLHMIQVTLGYMLMLCVMSYNTWIFLGVIAGSVTGYFLAFPLMGQT